MKNNNDVSKNEIVGNLNLISNTIKKVNFSEIENGNYLILWGVTTIFAGLTDFSQIYFFNNLNMFYNWGINGWYFYFIAGLISIYMYINSSIKDKKSNFFLTHKQFAAECIWITYISVITLFPLFIFFYEYIDFNNINSITHLVDVREYKFDKINYYSLNSLLVLFYCFPTLSIGRLYNNKLMIFGGIISFVLYLISFKTSVLIDQLLISISGLVNWLIPGIILKKEYLTYIKSKK